FAAFGMAAYVLRALRALGFLAAGLGAALALGWIAIQQGLWIPPVALAFAFAGGAVAGMAMRETMLRAERNMVMALFGRHVSPEVAELLWRQRGALIQGGRLK